MANDIGMLVAILAQHESSSHAAWASIAICVWDVRYTSGG